MTKQSLDHQDRIANSKLSAVFPECNSGIAGTVSKQDVERRFPKAADREVGVSNLDTTVLQVSRPKVKGVVSEGTRQKKRCRLPDGRRHLIPLWSEDIDRSIVVVSSPAEFREAYFSSQVRGQIRAEFARGATAPPGRYLTFMKPL